MYGALLAGNTPMPACSLYVSLPATHLAVEFGPESLDEGRRPPDLNSQFDACEEGPYSVICGDSHFVGKSPCIYYLT